MVNETKEPKKIDWKKKGLGWIPDYPDLRDYDSENNKVRRKDDGRLRREEVTGTIEDLAESLVLVLKILQKNKSQLEIDYKQVNKLLDESEQENNTDQAEQENNTDQTFEKLIEKLENKVFGDISFVTVKLRKILRKPILRKPSFQRSPSTTETGRTSLQILALKSYFYFLINQKFLPSPQEFATERNSDRGEDKLIDFNDSKQVVDWLIEQEFDETTKQLAALFQCFSNIQVDGVVGLETLTTLNNHFLKPLDSYEQPQIWIEFEARRNDSEYQKKYKDFLAGKPLASEPSNVVKLVSIPSLIPNTSFELLLRRLRLYAAEQRSNESELIDQVKNAKTALERAKSSSRPTSEQNLISQINEKLQNLNIGNSNKNFTNWMNEELENLKIEDFNKAFFNEFSIIDPIVSVIMKLIVPLSRYRNLEEAIEEGLNILDQFALKGNQLNSLDLKSKEGNNKSRDFKITQEFLAEAIDQVKKNYKSDINSAVKEAADNGEEIATLCFYFLIGKFVERLDQHLNQHSKANGSDTSTPSRFDRQELFEIEDDASTPQIKDDASTSQPELFSADQIRIPVSKSLNVVTCLSDPEMRKRYLFLPGVVDLSFWCSAIEDQGSLNSCSAFAGVALLEYFTNRSRGKYTDASPLFLYKATRNLMNLTGDVGASLRETMKALVLFGVPAEEYWAYEEENVDEEPPPFCYSFAQNYQALKYFRLDYAGISRETLLFQIKAVLSAGFPCMFGFTIYTSAYEDPNPEKGFIPFPDTEKDRVVGGHAVVAVGYDDYKIIQHADHRGISRGALLIRNSWGVEWGEEGYGWLPYEYVLNGLTRDWWSLLKAEWFEKDSFGLGASNTGTGAYTKQP